ncbi:MAG: hypothetical protein DHS20C10_04010 [marine bacterium B5-7]|nr:MAG: hypothetical protein DHS20C10_04010 [marine bacterium B5-7]
MGIDDDPKKPELDSGYGGSESDYEDDAVSTPATPEKEAQPKTQAPSLSADQQLNLIVAECHVTSESLPSDDSVVTVYEHARDTLNILEHRREKLWGLLDPPSELSSASRKTAWAALKSLDSSIKTWKQKKQQSGLQAYDLLRKQIIGEQQAVCDDLRLLATQAPTEPPLMKNAKAQSGLRHDQMIEGTDLTESKKHRLDLLEESVDTLIAYKDASHEVYKSFNDVYGAVIGKIRHAQEQEKLAKEIKETLHHKVAVKKEDLSLRGIQALKEAVDAIEDAGPKLEDKLSALKKATRIAEECNARIGKAEAKLLALREEHPEQFNDVVTQAWLDDQRHAKLWQNERLKEFSVELSSTVVSTSQLASEKIRLAHTERVLRAEVALKMGDRATPGRIPPNAKAFAELMGASFSDEQARAYLKRHIKTYEPNEAAITLLQEYQRSAQKLMAVIDNLEGEEKQEAQAFLKQTTGLDLDEINIAMGQAEHQEKYVLAYEKVARVNAAYLEFKKAASVLVSNDGSVAAYQAQFEKTNNMNKNLAALTDELNGLQSAIRSQAGVTESDKKIFEKAIEKPQTQHRRAQTSMKAAEENVIAQRNALTGPAEASIKSFQGALTAFSHPGIVAKTQQKEIAEELSAWGKLAAVADLSAHKQQVAVRQEQLQRVKKSLEDLEAPGKSKENPVVVISQWNTKGLSELEVLKQKAEKQLKRAENVKQSRQTLIKDLDANAQQCEQRITVIDSYIREAIDAQMQQATQFAEEFDAFLVKASSAVETAERALNEKDLDGLQATKEHLTKMDAQVSVLDLDGKADILRNKRQSTAFNTYLGVNHTQPAVEILHKQQANALKKLGQIERMQLQLELRVSDVEASIQTSKDKQTRQSTQLVDIVAARAQVARIDSEHDDLLEPTNAVLAEAENALNEVEALERLHNKIVLQKGVVEKGINGKEEEINAIGLGQHLDAITKEDGEVVFSEAQLFRQKKHEALKKLGELNKKADDLGELSGKIVIHVEQLNEQHSRRNAEKATHLKENLLVFYRLIGVQEVNTLEKEDPRRVMVDRVQGAIAAHEKPPRKNETRLHRNATLARRENRLDDVTQSFNDHIALAHRKRLIAIEKEIAGNTKVIEEALKTLDTFAEGVKSGNYTSDMMGRCAKVLGTLNDAVKDLQRLQREGLPELPANVRRHLNAPDATEAVRTQAFWLQNQMRKTRDLFQGIDTALDLAKQEFLKKINLVVKTLRTQLVPLVRQVALANRELERGAKFCEAAFQFRNEIGDMPEKSVDEIARKRKKLSDYHKELPAAIKNLTNALDYSPNPLLASAELTQLLQSHNGFQKDSHAVSAHLKKYYQLHAKLEKDKQALIDLDNTVAKDLAGFETEEDLKLLISQNNRLTNISARLSTDVGSVTSHIKALHDARKTHDGFVIWLQEANTRAPALRKIVQEANTKLTTPKTVELKTTPADIDAWATDVASPLHDQALKLKAALKEKQEAEDSLKKQSEAATKLEDELYQNQLYALTQIRVRIFHDPTRINPLQRHTARKDDGVMAQVYRFRQGAEGVEAFHKRALLDKKDKKAKLVFNFDLTPREITEDQLSRPGGLLAISQTGYPYEIRGNTATINNAYRIEGEDAMTHQIRLMHTMMEAIMTLVDAGYETITLNGNPHTCLAAKQFIDEVINPNMPEGHQIKVNWNAPESLPDNAKKWSDQYIQHVKTQKKVVLDKTDLVSNAIHNQLARRQIKGQGKTRKEAWEAAKKAMKVRKGMYLPETEKDASGKPVRKDNNHDANEKRLSEILTEQIALKKELEAADEEQKPVVQGKILKLEEEEGRIKAAEERILKAVARTPTFFIEEDKQSLSEVRAKRLVDASQISTCAMEALKAEQAAEAEKTMPKPRPDSGQMGC